MLHRSGTSLCGRRATTVGLRTRLGDSVDPWIYVERINIEVEGIDPEESGLLQIRIDLNRVPEAEWQAFFESPAGGALPPSMHPPRLVSDAIRIRPPDDEVETYVEHVDERITTANEQYARQVLPQLQAEEADRDREAREQERRLQDAQTRIDQL